MSNTKSRTRPVVSPTATADKLPRRSIFGYAAGDAANNLAFTTASMFLLVYYTDVAGIPAAAAGTLLLVLRFFDAFTDIAAGRLVDKTNTKRWGKFRPFILFGSLPLLLLGLATFTIAIWAGPWMLLAAYVTYGLLGIAYTMVNIPYGSLAAAMTQAPGERAKLAAARSVGAALVGGALGIFVSPLLENGKDLQPVFTTLMVIFVVIGMALYLTTVFTTKEHVHRAVPHVSLKQSLATLKGNKPLLLLCISSLLLLTGMISLTTSQIYFLRDVFDSLELVPLISLAQLVLIFVLAPFVPAIVRKFGKRNAYIGSGIIVFIGSSLAFVAGNVWIAFAGMMFSMVGLMLINLLIWALEADTVEYGEWKTGVRSEGITYALFSFTRKAGQAVGGAVAAYSLALGGYVAHASEQTTAAEWGIRAGAAAIPAVFALLAALLMILYPLTDRRHAEIVAEIAAKRERESMSDEADPDLSTAALRLGEANPFAAGDDDSR